MVPADAIDRSRVDLAEAVTLGAVGLVAVVALEAYVLAALGIHHLYTVGVAALVTVAVAAYVVRRHRPVITIPSWRSLLPLVPAVLVVGLLSFPGFHYATGDKDPGIYVLHATSIADTGKLTIDKSPLQLSRALTEQDVPGAQWRGFDFKHYADKVIPSFFHMWPALLAVGFEAVGFRAMLVVVPTLALLSTMALYFLARRFGGTIVAVLASMLLATNMLQVWQSRYPTSEILGQMLFVGSCLALVVALQTKWRVAAFLAGVLATAGFVNRGEGVLVMLILGALVAVAAAWGNIAALCRWAAVGLLVPLPIALYQAYGPSFGYSQGNNVPKLTHVVAVLLLEFVFAVVVIKVPACRRALRRAAAPFTTGDGDAVRWLKLVGVLGVLGFAAIGVLRPLLGHDSVDYHGAPIRSYDERSLWRLALYFTWPGIGLAVWGAITLLWGRWRRERMVVCGLVLAFSVLFLYHARNSPQMMWWGRRFVPVVVPGLVLLAAMGVGVVLRHVRVRGAMYVLALLVVSGVIGMQARYSWALRGHDEKAGSYGVAKSVGALAGQQRGVFLWQQGKCCGSIDLLFGSSTWIISHNDSAVLPNDATKWGAYVAKIIAAVPSQPVFVVLNATTPAPSSSTMSYAAVSRLTGSLPVWEESNIHRPQRAYAYPYDFIVYSVSPKG